MSEKQQESAPILFVFGLCTILEGLCLVLTLGFILPPNIGLKFLIWNIERKTKQVSDTEVNDDE
jgi:hypothetical protein